jgi:hypothetical protein
MGCTYRMVEVRNGKIILIWKTGVQRILGRWNSDMRILK